MTNYEITYKNRLNEMLDLVIRRYGFEADQTIYFADFVGNRIDNANYQNREKIERLFKGLMK